MSIQVPPEKQPVTLYSGGAGKQVAAPRKDADYPPGANDVEYYSDDEYPPAGEYPAAGYAANSDSQYSQYSQYSDEYYSEDESYPVNAQPVSATQQLQFSPAAQQLSPAAQQFSPVQEQANFPVQEQRLAPPATATFAASPRQPFPRTAPVQRTRPPQSANQKTSLSGLPPICKLLLLLRKISQCTFLMPIILCKICRIRKNINKSC
jgi:hypothetical protein